MDNSVKSEKFNLKFSSFYVNIFKSPFRTCLSIFFEGSTIYSKLMVPLFSTSICLK